MWALQTALGGLTLDGQFGPKTGNAVERWQTDHGLAVDGVAGIATQRSLALKLGEQVRRRHNLPIRLLMGQIEKESGYQLGNHTAVYPANGSRDLGVVQRNDRFATWQQAFHVPDSLEKIGQNTRFKKDFYYDKPGAKTHRRAWELAAGSWNAPAWTDRLAAGQTLSRPQWEYIESYIGRVTERAREYYAGRPWPA